MPRVGSKHFSYGPKGIAAAKKASAKAGIPMIEPPKLNTKPRKSLPAQASPTARANAFGQMGSRRRKAK